MNSTDSSQATPPLSGALTSGERLGFLRLLAYSAPALPLQLLLLVAVIYLPSYYAMDTALTMGAVGAMFFLARMWDAVSDTLIGALSDNTRRKWRTRKPWLVAGTPILIVSSYFLFTPPSGGASSFYLLIWLTLFYLSWTMVQIPFLSWGAELSTDYQERSRITGFREAAGTIGVILASGLPLIFTAPQGSHLTDVLRTCFIAVALLLPLTVAIATRFVGSGPVTVTDPRVGWRDAFVIIRRNPLFLRFLGGYLLMATSWNIFLASIVFIIDFRLGMPGKYLSLVLLMNVSATISVFLFLKFFSNFDKHKMLSIGILGFVFFYLVVFALPPSNLLLTSLVFVMLGVCWAPVLVTPTSMLPDIVDIGRFKGHNHQPGIYMALYYMIIKIAMSVGIGVSLTLLEMWGLDLSAPSTEESQRAIEIVSLFLPAIICIPAVMIFWTYPVGRHKHSIAQRWTARRKKKIKSPEKI